MNDEERIRTLEATVAELERKVEFLMTQLGMTHGEPTGAPAADPLVLAELQKGNLIGAIKRYRELTRSGLKEAKEAVEAIDARLRLPQRGPPFR